MNNLLHVLPSPIITERLILRRYIEEDARLLLEASARNREHFKEYESDNVIFEMKDLDSAIRIIRDLAAEWQKGVCFFAGIFSKDTEEFLGQIYIGLGNPTVPEFEIGYAADIQHEGKGYITESVTKIVEILFNQIGAHRLSIECDDTNRRSIRVAERCGFKQEGHLRENKKHPDGRRTGTLLFARLKE